MKPHTTRQALCLMSAPFSNFWWKTHCRVMMFVLGGCGTVLKMFRQRIFSISMSIMVRHLFALGASSASRIVHGSGVDGVGTKSCAISYAPKVSDAPAPSDWHTRLECVECVGYWWTQPTYCGTLLSTSPARLDDSPAPPLHPDSEKELVSRGCCTRCLPAMHHPNPSSCKLVCDYPNLWELKEWAVLAAWTRQMGGWWRPRCACLDLRHFGDAVQ